jgi:predicted nucleic acid-binding protein
LILVDTSVWVDHLRAGDALLAGLLERGAVLMHPYVLGEIACGTLRDRAAILELLQDLPAVVTADTHEVMQFIERHSLHGKRIGYVDVHLLASVALTIGARLWTRAKRLGTSAQALHCAFRDPAAH